MPLHVTGYATEILHPATRKPLEARVLLANSVQTLGVGEAGEARHPASHKADR